MELQENAIKLTETEWSSIETAIDWFLRTCNIDRDNSSAEWVREEIRERKKDLITMNDKVHTILNPKKFAIVLM